MENIELFVRLDPYYYWIIIYNNEYIAFDERNRTVRKSQFFTFFRGNNLGSNYRKATEIEYLLYIDNHIIKQIKELACER